MAGEFQVRNNTSTVRLSYTPLIGEFFWDTTVGQMFAGDGSVVGGRLVSQLAPNGLFVTSYTVLDTDAGKLFTCSASGNIAVTLGQAGSSGGAFFPLGTGLGFINYSNHTVTITPTTSQINGSTAALILNPGDSAILTSDGTNYWALIWRASVEAIETIFSMLPTPVRGMRAVITDSPVNTWGTNITAGSGGNVVLSWYNGTHWTVLGI